MRYREFDFGNPVCLHVVLSSRAYAGILSQALRDVREETGGVFLGRVHNRIWYVMEAVTLPFSEASAVFSWEPEEVRLIAEFCRGLYQEPLEVLGFWHRHPPRMDYFSPEDEQVLQSGQWPHGQLAMLVNADPDLRLSFYCCNGMELMPAEYDHGDEYFLEELLACPDPETLAERYHSQVRVRPHRDMEPEQLPQSPANPKRKSGQVQAESGKAEKKTGQVQAESRKKEAKSPESAAGEALARELMRRLEEATTRMPSSYMARLRDQNERILALLEELLREELLREQETPPVPERVPEAAERPLETADGPSELPKKEKSAAASMTFG